MLYVCIYGVEQKEQAIRMQKEILRVQTLNSVGWAIIFGYFALHFDSDPSSCYAFEEEHESHEHALTPEMRNGDGDWSNVGQTFRGAFMTQFICMCMFAIS